MQLHIVHIKVLRFESKMFEMYSLNSSTSSPLYSFAPSYI